MNFDVVKQLVAYGREQEKLHDKHFRFTLTTNGVLLNDDIMEFANKEMDNVVLSIDGRKEVNDRMRPFRKGAGSYDLIVPKFQKLAESRNQERYYVRGTYTHFNTDFSKDVLHLADLGFKQISVEPVVAQPTDEYALQEEDLPVLFEEYDKLAAEMVRRNREGNSFNFFHFMIDLEGGPCVYKRLSGCGSGTEYLAVTPWGDLYPCHQFVGNEEFLMGNVWDGVKIHSFGTSLNAAMSMQKKSAVSALQDFTVVGDVLQIHTISMGRSQMHMIWDASSRRNVSNAQS